MKCPKCGYSQPEPDGERGEHPCGRCGWNPVALSVARANLKAACFAVFLDLEHEFSDEDVAMGLGFPLKVLDGENQ